MSTASVTLLTGERGDFEVHLGGCSDIPKASRRYPDRVATFSGETLKDAIVALDTDLADMFGQEVYEPAPDDQPWTTEVSNPAPCLRKAMQAAGLRFGENGRPFEPAAFAFGNR